MTWTVFKTLTHYKPTVIYAAIAVLLMGICMGLISGANNPLQRWLYDLSQRNSASTTTDSPVVIVAIDEDSKAKLGEWPWSNTLSGFRSASAISGTAEIRQLVLSSASWMPFAW